MSSTSRFPVSLLAELALAVAVVAAVALGGAGCRSSTPHYYTLVPPAADVHPEAGALAIELEPVDVPADVDRSELVVRRGASEVATADSRAWIAPLPLEIRRALESDLGAKLDIREGAPYRVKLIVRRFDSTLGERALIDVAWTIHTKDKNLTCESRASEPATAAGKEAYETLVLAHQRALGVIAASIVSSVTAVASGVTDDAIACPKSAPTAAAAR